MKKDVLMMISALLTSGNGASSRFFVRERENIRPNNII